MSQTAVLNGTGLPPGFLATSRGAIDAYHEAVLKLRDGNYSEGLADYERRWEHPHFLPHRRDYPVPQWTGEPLMGRKILVWHEQGFGDSIMMHRFLPLLEQMAAVVHIEIPPPLVSLFEANTQQRHEDGQASDFDCHCPVMSLPFAFKTTPATIPPPARMVAPRQGRQWKLQSAKPKIGICWSGDSRNPDDDLRSIPLAQLAHVLRLDASFIPLQYDYRREDLQALEQLKLPNLPYEDFGELAGIIDQLDLVIAVDTAVAHLAGAMLKPTWVLIPEEHYWIWLKERTDSPWYPTVRLFRQAKLGSWAETLARLRTALQLWITTSYRPRIVATAG